MNGDNQRTKRILSGLLLLSVVACFGAAGCGDIHPEPNIEEGGMVDAPTHEADSYHEAVEHEERK